MRGELNLAIVGAIFVASVALVVGTGLFVISMVLRLQARKRKRVNRVSRRRMSGRIDIDDIQLSVVRQSDDSSRVVQLTDVFAKFVPFLDTKRIRANVSRAGMNMSVGLFVLISLIVAAVALVLGSLLLDYPLFVQVVPALLLGMLAVDRFVIMRGNMNSNKFMKQLPDALDTMIRGIRSGLPVIETIVTIGEEFDDPVAAHFRSIGERVKLGESLDSALWSVARVVNRPEMDFLAVCISIQIETGGSLGEALANLSDLLRKRQQMKLKIRAISSEAKASAMIIGALPFVMLGLLSVMSPEYVSPLFFDPRGQMLLMIGGGSISMGAFVMWRMTQFEI